MRHKRKVKRKEKGCSAPQAKKKKIDDDEMEEAKKGNRSHIETPTTHTCPRIRTDIHNQKRPSLAAHKPPPPKRPHQHQWIMVDSISLRKDVARCKISLSICRAKFRAKSSPERVTVAAFVLVVVVVRAGPAHCPPILSLTHLHSTPRRSAWRNRRGYLQMDI